MTPSFLARSVAAGFVTGLGILGCGEVHGNDARPPDDLRYGIVGTLEVRIASYTGHAQTFYRLVREDGEEIPLDFGTDELPAGVGQRMLVRGPREGNRVMVDGYDILGRDDRNQLQEVVTDRVRRNFRIAAIILDPKVPPAMFRSRVFGAFDSLAAVYGENSYGEWTLEGDVFGPYSIPIGDCTDPTISKLAEAAKGAAMADGLDPSLYDKFLYRLPPDASCTWNSLSDFGVNEVRGLISGVNTWYTLTDCATLAHALGVSFGLRRSQQCTAPPYVAGGYGPPACEGAFHFDPFTPMGNACGHLSAPESGALGFISGCNTLDVTTSRTFEIGPIEAKCAGPQVIRISANATLNFGPQYIYVEYRLGGQAVRSDVVSTRGIYFHASAEYGGNRTNIPDASYSRYYALDSLYIRDPMDTVDATWTEPSSGATFKLLAMGPTATVEVTIPGTTPAPARCIDGAPPPAAPMCARTLARFRDAGTQGDSANTGGNAGSADSGSTGAGLDADDGDCSCTLARKAKARAPAALLVLAALLPALRRRAQRFRRLTLLATPAPLVDSGVRRS